ncbi:hypothetical protein ACFX13_024189 [Malus domestica]
MGHRLVALLLLATMATTVLTTSQSMDNATPTDTGSPSSTSCDDGGLNDPSCLTARADMLDDVDEESMMDSEIGRRMLAGGDSGFTGTALKSKAEASESCGKQAPPCYPPPNPHPPVHCDIHNRDCVRN